MKAQTMQQPSSRTEQCTKTLPPASSASLMNLLLMRKNFLASSSVVLRRSMWQYLKQCSRLVYYLQVTLRMCVMPSQSRCRDFSPVTKLPKQTPGTTSMGSKLSNRQLGWQPQKLECRNRQQFTFYSSYLQTAADSTLGYSTLGMRVPATLACSLTLFSSRRRSSSVATSYWSCCYCSVLALEAAFLILNVFVSMQVIYCPLPSQPHHKAIPKGASTNSFIKVGCDRVQYGTC